MKLICISIFFVMLVGCSSTPRKVFAPEAIESGQSLIYIYREKQFEGSGSPTVPRLYVNGEQIANLKMGGYYPVKVEPGTVELNLINTLFGAEVNEPYGNLEFSIEDGQTMYLKYSLAKTEFNAFDSTLVSKGESHFNAMPEEAASQEIKTYKLLAKPKEKTSKKSLYESLIPRRKTSDKYE